MATVHRLKEKIEGSYLKLNGRKALTKDIGDRAEPFTLHHEYHAIQKRHEQESVLELRRRAIGRWLKQLPNPKNERTMETMWIDGLEGGGIGRDRDDDGIDVHSLEGSEETPLDDNEKKSLPSELESPLEAYNGSEDMWDKRDGHQSTFMDKWKTTEGNTDGEDSVVIHEVPEQPLKSLHEALLRDPLGSTISEDGWSTVSEGIDGISPKEEDTAYVGSSTGSRKGASKARFHDKYKISLPTFDPPSFQKIEPQSPTHVRPFVAEDIKPEVQKAKVPDGEWWLPNILFGGILNCTNVHLSDSESDDADVDDVDVPESSAQADRVLSRLSHRQSIGRGRTLPKIPTIIRLQSRMLQAKRRQLSTVECTLEHPLTMKSMMPDGDRTPHPLMPPEIRRMDYLSPPSVTDLSDLDCYAGSMLPNMYERREYPEGGHQCQTWVLEKLFCFLGGRLVT